MHVQMKTVTNFRSVDCMLKITAEYNSTSKTDDFKQQNITSISRKKREWLQMQIRRWSQFIEFVFRDPGLSGSQKMMIVLLYESLGLFVDYFFGGFFHSKGFWSEQKHEFIINVPLNLTKRQDMLTTDNGLS